MNALTVVAVSYYQHRHLAMVALVPYETNPASCARDDRAPSLCFERHCCHYEKASNASSFSKDESSWVLFLELSLC